MATHIATFQGITAKRVSPRTYTHALFVLTTAAKTIRRLEAEIQSLEGYVARYTAQAERIRASGKVETGHRHLDQLSPEAAAAEYDRYAADSQAHIERARAAIPVCRAQGDRWGWLSMHQSSGAALKAQAAARAKGWEQVVVVPVTRTLNRKEQIQAQAEAERQRIARESMGSDFDGTLTENEAAALEQRLEAREQRLRNAPGRLQQANIDREGERA